MIINNTTDMPMPLVRIALRHALDCLPDKGAGIELESVTIRNKMEGKVSGQWGWYKPQSKQIVVIVPREMPHGYKIHLKHARQYLTINTRVEFLIAVVAHEMKHAHQWQVMKTWTVDTRSNRWYRERDAEQYESDTTIQWMNMIQKVASSS
ncbi:MAG: hypothetical protein H0U60_19655 [Blastocatellia bacterium]|nr:hypothetical protein [Blastocatellia bacterium]